MVPYRYRMGSAGDSASPNLKGKKKNQRKEREKRGRKD